MMSTAQSYFPLVAPKEEERGGNESGGYRRNNKVVCDEEGLRIIRNFK